MSKEKKNTEIQAAHINTKGVIIASIITAVAIVVATIIAALMNGVFSRTSAKPEAERSFSLISVKRGDDGMDITEFRLTIEVNGNRYSYPTKTTWANIYEPSLPFSFPIELSEKYNVYFIGFYRGTDGKETQYSPQPIDTIHWTGKLERRDYTALNPLIITYELHQ